MSSTPYLSCAESAKFVREALKKAFPKTKFSVRSHHGSSVFITYTDGPSVKQVETITNRFKGSTYDINEDLHKSVPGRHPVTGEKVYFGSDSFHVDRNHTPDFLKSIAVKLAEKWGLPVPEITVQADGFASVVYDHNVRPNNSQFSLSQLVEEEARNTSALKRKASKPKQQKKASPSEPKTTQAQESEPIPEPEPEPGFGDEKVAQRFETMADGYQKDIDKLRNRHSNVPLTRKRRQEIEQALIDARNLEIYQDRLRSLAKAHREQRVPESLRGVTTKAQVERLATHNEWPDPNTYAIDAHDRMVKAGIITPKEYYQAFADLKLLSDPTAGQETPAHKIRRLEREAVSMRLDDFFPTPADLVDKMIRIADIRTGNTVLEPSAGKGDIADALVKWGFPVDVIEIAPTLAEILRLKGHTVIASDFIAFEGSYDRIIMNPPFSKGLDVEHVQQAYKNLNPGGRLVAIMCEGPFFRQDKKSAQFRGWLENLTAWDEKLPDRMFDQGERPTGVQTRLVVIDKPEEPEPQDEPKPMVKPANPDQPLVKPVEPTSPKPFDPDAQPMVKPANPDQPLVKPVDPDKPLKVVEVTLTQHSLFGPEKKLTLTVSMVQGELFPSSQVLQFGVNGHPYAPITDTTRLELQSPDPRTEDQKEQDVQREAEANTEPLPEASNP